MKLQQHRFVQGWHLNAANILYGGRLLSWADHDTTMFAYNCSIISARYTTLGFDRIRFLRPSPQGERLRFEYKIGYVGKSSLMIFCLVYNTKNETVFQAINTTVAIGKDDKPTSINDYLLEPVKEYIKEIKGSVSWKWMETVKENGIEKFPVLS